MSTYTDVDIARYNNIRAKAFSTDSPKEKDVCLNILAKVRKEYPGIAVAARDVREKAAAAPNVPGFDPFAEMRKRAAAGDLGAKVFSGAIDWALGVLKEQNADDYNELWGMFMGTEKDKTVSSKPAKALTTKELTKKIKRGLTKDAEGPVVILEPKFVDDDPEKDLLSADSVVLDLTIPYDLWVLIHDDPAAFVEWCDENIQLDEDEDEDESTDDDDSSSEDV